MHPVCAASLEDVESRKFDEGDIYKEKERRSNEANDTMGKTE